MKNQKRRRREAKTNYLRRLKMLKSGKPRLVFRKTNRYLVAQYVESKEAKDQIKKGFNSKVLLKYGWPKELGGSLKSIPASYLLGFLIGKEIIREKMQIPIIDFGLYPVLHKNKLHGFVKGIVDAGVKIKYEEKCFPEKERIQGKTKDFVFEKIKQNIEKNDK